MPKRHDYNFDPYQQDDDPEYDPPDTYADDKETEIMEEEGGDETE